MADGFFVVFMLSFFAMRLGMYPYICWSAHVEATQYFPKGLPEWTAVVLLYILMALQVKPFCV
jgi:ceramide synthetase